MTFRALCPHCDVASRYTGSWRGRSLVCGNARCGRSFVAEFVIEESTPAPEPARPAPKPSTRTDPASRAAAAEGRPKPAEPPPRDIPFAMPVAVPLARPVPTQSCPRCNTPVLEGIEVCPKCHTHLESGRRYVVARKWDKERDRAALSDGWLGVWSVFVPISFLPLPYASEAPLRRPPWAVLAVALCCFVAFPVGYSEWASLHLFHWSGDPSLPVPRPEGMPEDVPMPPVGRFAWHQLVTSQFLHGGVEHLLMNMVMLLVVGPKVNDVLGHGRFILAYLTLGIVAGFAPLLLNLGQPPAAGLGASGSIMGIAGMYLVISPQPFVRLLMWTRFSVFSPLYTWLFRIRGVWLVLILYGLDLLAIFLGASDNIGHDVHFTGFTVGALSTALLVAMRRIKCGGYDLLTWLFGQEDVEEDRDLAGVATMRWNSISNAPVILLPFVAVMLFAVGVFFYRLVTWTGD